uniref:Seipin n=1 Tax=Lepeophtheirus salmonis TaxID=72036 RepID=A0A0K2UDI8_LEPSM
MQRIRNVHSGLSSRIISAKQFPARTKDKIGSAALMTWDLCYNCFTIAISMIVLSVISFMIYGAFYYGYIPAPLIKSPMTMTFKPCHSSPSKCSVVSSSYNLSEILMNDQPYFISVRLKLPDSPVNRDHGMFMSCLKVFGKNGSMLREHCKSSLFPHRSFITRQLRNLIISPGSEKQRVIAGYWNEYETIEIDFFKEFMDMDPYNPAKWITFVIKSRFLDVYSAELRILADFKGIRAFMYYYPITAAILGSVFYLSVLISVLVISWLHLHGENYIKKGFEDSVDDMDDTSEDSMDSEKPEIEDLYNSNLDFSRKNWF